MKKVIAIDLGSNSIRFLKMDCQTKEFIGKFHLMVKTADGLATTGLISIEAQNRIINAINQAKEQIDFSDATIKAITTEAVRQAKNGQEILNCIKKQTGVEFNIINGDDEARYALIATQNRLKQLNIEPSSFMLADIGGASTELIFFYGKETIVKSFPIGIVTITQSFHSLLEISHAIPALMKSMRLFCQEVYAKYGKAQKFIAIAGTPTTIASMKHGFTYKTYNANKIHGTVLTHNDLVHQLERLLSMEIAERKEIVGVGREELISSGVLIYEELYNIGGFNESIVIDDGVREGVVLDMCGNS
jgi:exopolyphosphatase/guanosine-5'-triphosphate,3'-diphosphate pyrophosphatase